MSEARFMLVLGHQAGVRLTPQWPGGGRSVQVEPASRSWIAWRLLGSNHRELARSASVYADVVDCCENIRALREGLLGGLAESRSEPCGGLWTWVLTIGGQPLAVASRLYHRQRESEHSYAVFAACAPTADMAGALCRTLSSEQSW